MDYYICGHSHEYDIYNVIGIFYTVNKSSRLENKCDGVDFVSSEIIGDECITTLYENKQIKDVNVLKIEDTVKNAVKKSCYVLLSKNLNFENPWGTLIGIKPSKIPSDLYNQGFKDSEILEIMQNKNLVRLDKAELALNVYKNQIEILKNSAPNSCGVYIGIPFCPTRCLYCSFPSFLIEKYAEKMSDYFDAMEKEMIFISNYARENNITIETLYVGGGTPTSLGDCDLEKLCNLINKYFNPSELKEFTVEAGRPDTITKSKLEILKKYGVGRLSINPQTLNESTLKKIERNHTLEDFYDKYNLAQQIGFENINIDIILGLPDENINLVENTFENLLELKVNSLTVHTLSIKRGSNLISKLENYYFPNFSDMEDMINLSMKYADKMGLRPYYMYRQKNMIGNFENVGYAKKEFFGVYNIQMMEERQTVLGIGAGTTSKFYFREKELLKRIFNVKNIEEYISRIDEMIDRKKKVLEEENLWL